MEDPMWDEYLEIDGIPLAIHAFFVESLAPLFNVAKRGGDRLIPTANGVRPYRRRVTILQVSLDLDVFGDVDIEGAPVTDVRDGVYTNLHYLRDNLIADPGTADGTRSAVWAQPDGSFLSAPCHVEGLTVVGQGMVSAKCALDLSFPTGWWETGS